MRSLVLPALIAVASAEWTAYHALLRHKKQKILSSRARQGDPGSTPNHTNWKRDETPSITYVAGADHRSLATQLALLQASVFSLLMTVSAGPLRIIFLLVSAKVFFVSLKAGVYLKRVRSL